jgi:hypothetical protein
MYVISFSLSLSLSPFPLDLELERHSINYSLLVIVYIISLGIDPLLFLSFDGEREWEKGGCVSDENNISNFLFSFLFLFSFSTLPFPFTFRTVQERKTSQQKQEKGM